MEFLKKIFSPITATMNYIQNHFKAMVFVLILILIFAPASKKEFTNYNLQKINLSGPIVDATEIVEKINKAANNNAIKGVLLSVNSPGGAVSPSIEIAYAIKRLKIKKPVVAYAKGTMASGSYYASIWADKIIANPGSMIGSIGVIMQGADLSGLMNKIGIKSQVVKAGLYKQIGTPDRPWKKYEVAELNKVIKGTYDMFTKDVADARKLDFKKRDTYANAHIFTAAQAKKVGLVDQLGVEYNAKNELEKLSGVAHPVWNQEDKLDKIMKKLTASTAVILNTYFPDLVLK
ncbi:signal peptide peptidase SppA [Sulfurimonas autotrophica]|uniref:Signal peptide peptidase SppA, 36K type n=1 Tax=Sulfurimonas autotrophica (strain ATCC BAA-671 / DSM 16294 / JCM 11897 / OK10) TaxID=563040 RepID=E0UQF5_SULAO|nr:signal peptide peptidase SppA [Sulfurimonas autotrophica]ADN08757.1 signal peptide peptidase SppA, 36K type [Sulfurimonas autotrophica DSM 16294]